MWTKCPEKNLYVLNNTIFYSVWMEFVINNYSIEIALMSVVNINNNNNKSLRVFDFLGWDRKYISIHIENLKYANAKTMTFFPLMSLSLYCIKMAVLCVWCVCVCARVLYEKNLFDLIIPIQTKFIASFINSFEFRRCCCFRHLLS